MFKLTPRFSNLLLAQMMSLFAVIWSIYFSVRELEVVLGQPSTGIGEYLLIAQPIFTIPAVVGTFLRRRIAEILLRAAAFINFLSSIAWSLFLILLEYFERGENHRGEHVVILVPIFYLLVGFSIVLLIRQQERGKDS